MTLRIPLALATLALAATPAAAHVGPMSEHASFSSGLFHPLLGWDHLIAMVMVGVWAATLTRLARWTVPAAFVTIMGVGFILALSGANLPFVEPMILASLVVLGLLAALAVRLPAFVAGSLVGAFALFHGFAHGAELHGASALWFAVGFALTTAALHLAGLGLGRQAVDRGGQIALRLAGVASASTGLFLMAV